MAQSIHIDNSQLVWKESVLTNETKVGIELKDLQVVVSDKSRSRARYLAAKVCFFQLQIETTLISSYKTSK